MLGGSVCIALIRFFISLVGVIVLFLLMSESRFSKKKTAAAYAGFILVVVTLGCVWYVLDWTSCVRMVSFAMYLCFVAFSIYMGRGPVFILVYKLALIYYMLAVFLITGIEVSTIFFDGNVWVDIILRIVLILGMTLLIEKKMKNDIRGFGDYVESELDRFSVVLMIISILCGMGFIMNPNIRDHTPYRLYQIGINFFLIGALQFQAFRLYLHIGKEKEYQKEYQLMQMNHRLLERNVELLEESVEAGKRIRHDARHHNAVIAEYVRRGQDEELLHYLKEYEKEMDAGIATAICANTAVNNVLSAYTRRAEAAGIEVTLDVELGKELTIPSIDLVAILANAYENAIYGCTAVKKQSEERECFIYLMLKRKWDKLVMCCSNTCIKETAFKGGQPKPEFTGGVGVLSITKTADKYKGEYDFNNDNGVFIFRLVMNIPPANEEEQQSDSQDRVAEEIQEAIRERSENQKEGNTSRSVII